jgi:hypothetical protein
MSYELRFFDKDGEAIGEEAKMESVTSVPILNVGEVVTAPNSGYFEVATRVFFARRRPVRSHRFRSHSIANQRTERDNDCTFPMCANISLKRFHYC